MQKLGKQSYEGGNKEDRDVVSKQEVFDSQFKSIKDQYKPIKLNTV